MYVQGSHRRKEVCRFFGRPRNAARHQLSPRLGFIFISCYRQKTKTAHRRKITAILHFRRQFTAICWCYRGHRRRYHHIALPTAVYRHILVYLDRRRWYRHIALSPAIYRHFFVEPGTADGGMLPKKEKTPIAENLPPYGIAVSSVSAQKKRSRRVHCKLWPAAALRGSSGDRTTYSPARVVCFAYHTLRLPDYNP